MPTSTTVTKKTVRQERLGKPKSRQGNRVGSVLSPLPTIPGAQAIRGPDPPSPAADEYTLSPPMQQDGTPSHAPSTVMLPVSARVVHDEGDYEELQERLDRQGEELQRVLANLENAAVATVLTNDVELGNYGNNQMNDDESSSDDTGSDQAPKSAQESRTMSSRICGIERKWIIVAAAFLVLVIVCVALGVALSKKGHSPSIENTNDDNAPLCQVNSSGQTVCLLQDYPAKGFNTAFVNCPDGATSVLQCGSCGIAPPNWSAGDDLCSSCSVCSNTLAYDCSNVATGSCTKHDCSGNCASE